MSKRDFIIGGIAILVLFSFINLSYPKEVEKIQPKQIVQDIEIKENSGKAIEHESEEIAKLKKENQKLKDYIQLVEKKMHQDDFNKLKAITESFYQKTQNLLIIIAVLIPLLTLLFTWIMQRGQLKLVEKKQEEILKSVEKKQEETLKSVEKKQEEALGQIREEQKEIRWIETLKQKVEADPFLQEKASIEVIESIGEHFSNDQGKLAWELYGVGRYFDRERKHEQALKYYQEAERKECRDIGLMLHVYQSIGVDYFWIGKSLEINNQTKDAIKSYKKAVKYYHKVIDKDPQFAEAHNNKGITLIELGKLEKNKEKYKEAIACLDKVIDLKPTNYDPYYDKARAYSLLNQKDNAIESLKHSFRLAKRDEIGDLLKHLKDDIKDFESIENDKEFIDLIGRYKEK